MSSLLIAWYKSNIEKDEQEAYEQNIAISEYLASFINPHAVEALRNRRDKEKSSNQEDFLRTLRTISGEHLTEEQIRKNLEKNG